MQPSSLYKFSRDNRAFLKTVIEHRYLEKKSVSSLYSVKIRGRDKKSTALTFLKIRLKTYKTVKISVRVCAGVMWAYDKVVDLSNKG